MSERTSFITPSFEWPLLQRDWTMAWDYWMPSLVFFPCNSSCFFSLYKWNAIHHMWLLVLWRPFSLVRYTKRGPLLSLYHCVCNHQHRNKKVVDESVFSVIFFLWCFTMMKRGRKKYKICSFVFKDHHHFMIVVSFSCDWLLLYIIWEFPRMCLKFRLVLCNFLLLVF